MMTRRVVGLLLITSLALVGCGGDTDDACAKIYETCNGALLDEEGTSLSQESCVRKMDEFSRSDPEGASALFECVKKIEKEQCEALAACF